ncbi:salivary glue protein Sgs-3-like [Mytilus edulis]|uniref:salivary glue protein Sgs-3-like n=1 Tax=Mytilus edulis TaxID=6550 RepID=UPI0039F13011
MWRWRSKFLQASPLVMNRTISPSTSQTTSPTTNTTTVLPTAETDYVSKTLQSYISKTAAVTFPTTTKRIVTFPTTTKIFKPTPVNLVSMTTVSKSTSPSKTINFLDLLLHVIDNSNLNISFTDMPPTLKAVMEEVNSHNSTNVDIATVNSILTQLDMLTNGTTQFGIPELSNILLSVSK